MSLLLLAWIERWLHKLAWVGEGRHRSLINREQKTFLEKAMATYSGTLAWKLPWTEEPGRLQSMGSQRVRHGWATSLSLFTFMHWRRKRQPTPVFSPIESHGWRSLVGYSPRGRKESDMTEQLHYHFLSSVLAWRIPGTEKPGRLPSMGSHRVRHNWSDAAAAAAAAAAVQ